MPPRASAASDGSKLFKEGKSVFAAGQNLLEQ